MPRNSETLLSFVSYCQAHPEQRFWQALRNWSGYNFIYAASAAGLIDTFYWEGQTYES